MPVNLGTAKLSITPEKPVALAGFSFRTGKAEEIHSPLYLKAFSFCYPDGKRLILLVADLIWWGNDTVELCREALGHEEPLRGVEVVFHATHTHCGPQVSRLFGSELGEVDPEYLDFLVRRARQVCLDAIKNEEPVEACFREGETLIPINRRLLTEDGLEMKPNPLGEVNRTLTVTDFQRRDGTLKARWVHSACHQTTSADCRVSAEYAGLAAERYSQELPGQPVVAFLQGFCADVRPAMIEGDKFYRGSLDDETEELAGRFLEETRLAAQAASQPLALSPSLNLKKLEVPLPLASDFPHKNYAECVHLCGLEEEPLGEWGRHWSAQKSVPDSLTVALFCWKLSDGFIMVFANAEVVTHYASLVSSLTPAKTLCCGYTNGMTTYIPTAQQLREGGYEAYKAMFWFLAPAPFAPESEPAFTEALKQLLT